MVLKKTPTINLPLQVSIKASALIPSFISPLSCGKQKNGKTML